VTGERAEQLESGEVLDVPADEELRLTVLDDYPWHQTTAPLPLPATSDSHFNDGYYWGFFTHGRFCYFGMRLYPNTNVMDSFAGGVFAGEQRTVRASRALRPRVHVLEVGPLRLTILEPMRRQRLELTENPSGIEFDVTITATSPAFFESPDIHHRRGRLINHVLRYTQLGRAEGELTVDGETEAIDRWYSDRDHSWGIRSSMGPQIPIRGTEPSRGDPRAIRMWLPFELEDHCAMFSLHEDSEGNRIDFDGRIYWRDGRDVQLADARHAFRYLAGTRRLVGGELTLVTEDGEEHDYELAVVGDPWSAQGLGYVRGWQDGGTPGTWRGESHLESDRFVVDDPAEIAGPPHVPVEKRLGACEYPIEVRDSKGQSGIAQFEHMVYRAYRPYGLD
jgi:hypothetical protein